MIKQNPELNKLIKKRKSDLYFPIKTSKFQPLGKNSDTLDGLNSHLVIMDELHSVKDRNCYAIGDADLSITTDLTCAALLMMDKTTEERFITLMYWLSRDNF